MTAIPPAAKSSVRIRSSNNRSRRVPNRVKVPCTTNTLTALKIAPTPYSAVKMTVMKPSRLPLMMYNCGVFPLASSIAPKMVRGPTQNKSDAVTKPVTNRLSELSDANFDFKNSPSAVRRSSTRIISPMSPPRTMPTSGKTMLWVFMTSLSPSAMVTNPITCTTVTLIRSGIR